MFKALWLESQDGKTVRSMKSVDEQALPDGDVTVAVEYSCLNYKDALAITGKAPVVRRFPMIPGIDLAGTVIESRDPAWKAGDRILQCGWDHGEVIFGGLAERARVWGKHLVRIPEGLSPRSAMSLGTAGFTAALAVQALVRHGIEPSSGKVLVTGAGGGVGGIAIALLHQRGYTVIASSGRTSETPRLTELGAAEVIDRESLNKPGKPLAKEVWAGAIDNVGSHTLVNVCAATKARGLVAACGNVQGMDFPGSVAPFILRGVTLAGINSPYVPAQESAAAWDELASLPRAVIDTIASEVGMADAIAAADRVIAGQVSGRIVVAIGPGRHESASTGPSA
jgi:acrylyl-CoA reductase (NADPH)